MKEESNPKKLRKGYTTGTCAQAATKAATMMLLTGKEVTQAAVRLPGGEEKVLMIENTTFQSEEGRTISVRCGVKKDSGDDPDVTNQIIVYSTVCYAEQSGITVDGGNGVGRVTKPGLEQGIGCAAINKVPRAMILKEAEEAASFYECEKGLTVIIDVPEGEKIARNTFNPRLGIIGGISILGTSGIVNPMSEQALIDTIEVELKVKKSDIGSVIIAVPGNYGLDFLEREYEIMAKDAVKCSNFVGETIDFANVHEVEGLLFAAHIGKFIKVAGGIMNTHSKYADCRMELLSCAAMEAGCSIEICRKLLSAATTEGALQLLTDEERKRVMECVMKRIERHLKARADKLKIGAIVFSNECGILGMTKQVPELLEAFQMQKKDR